MSTVTFFLLAGDSEDARARFACKLAANFCYEKSRVHILASNRDSLRRLDELLWEYPSNRFVPHEILGGTSGLCLVTLSHEDKFDGSAEVLINTTNSIPQIAGQFQRICEIVLASGRHRARDHYRHYRSLKYDLFHEEHEGDPASSSLSPTTAPEET